MSVIAFIKRHIAKYKDLLANLSRKNRELFYREGRSFSINLTTHPKVDSQFLVTLQEKYNPLRAYSATFQELLNSSELNLSKHFLIDEIQNSNLIQKLDKIRLADQKFEKEFGISGAWVLGPFLCWRNSNLYKPEELLISPIFKLPIDINKDKKKNWILKLEEADLKINPSLRLALRQKCGIEIPEIFETNNAREALDEFKALIEKAGKSVYIDNKLDTLPRIPPKYKIKRDEQGDIIEKVATNIHEYLSKNELDIYIKTSNTEFIILDVIFIDHMNASRVVLLRDYDAILDSETIHPILSELFLGKAIPNENNDTKDAIKALDSYKENENYFVVNADSSQHRAIDQTRIRNTVVIQGPPGTGKSQTITNLIAKNLAEGKKVLFVSEKRAALDVVNSRLQQANLSGQSVLIHSSDLNKQELYNSFLELSATAHEEDIFSEWNNITQEFDSCKKEINSYYRILEKKHNCGLLISDILAYKADVTIEKNDLKIAQIFSNLSIDKLQSACNLLNELQSNVSKINDYPNHPWLMRKNNAIYTASFESTFNQLVDKITNHFMSFDNFRNELITLGVRIECLTPNIIDSLNGLLCFELGESEKDFIDSYLLKDELIKERNEKINKISKTIESLYNYYELFNPNIKIDTQMVEACNNYYSCNHNFFSLLTPKFWAIRSIRKKYLLNWDGTNRPFRAYLTLRKAILIFTSIFHNHNNDVNLEQINPQVVLEECKEILALFKVITMFNFAIRGLESDFEQKLSNFLPNRITKILDAFRKIIELQKLSTLEMNECFNLKSEICKYLEYRTKPDVNFQDVENFQLLSKTIQDLTLLDCIDLKIEKIRQIVTRFNRDVIINHLMAVSINWGDYVFDVVVKYWVDELFVEYPEIRTFDSATFIKKIETFNTLENEHRELARKFVNNTLYHRWNKGTDEFEGLSLLRREANKRNKVKPPREIMEQGALGTMLKLKPCWLMSPLSISQILPLEMGIFDMVIFDEASQVRVEDAVPSIYRGKTMVVVGDLKQMPPTNFFINSNEDNDEEDPDDIEMSPSLLDLASQIYPSEILEWHYRSKSESLIAFSNRAFYGGRLIAAPNPNLITEGDSLALHVLDNATYHKTDGNTIEAEYLVEKLYCLLQQASNKSYGVIAMGQPQMKAIEEVIEKRKSNDPKFKKYLEIAESNLSGNVDAGLFVKSLENVQGDERDIILISVGYGPSSLGKRVHMNFGPLSKSGGGRRLNVAITRAKEKIEIFCSFDPNIIPTDENDFKQNPDLVLFGRYLKFAQAIHEKKYNIALNILNSFGVGGVISNKKSSNFALDVKRRLEEIGYNVSAEIGSSGFYIDLAVHHPVIQTNFILGIECDGAIFHSTPYARDRDKIRQNLLESRGWKICRIWSQDWSKDWKFELYKLDQILKQLMGSIQ